MEKPKWIECRRCTNIVCNECEQFELLSSVDERDFVLHNCVSCKDMLMYVNCSFFCKYAEICDVFKCRTAFKNMKEKKEYWRELDKKLKEEL